MFLNNMSSSETVTQLSRKDKATSLAKLVLLDQRAIIGYRRREQTQSFKNNEQLCVRCDQEISCTAHCV